MARKLFVVGVLISFLAITSLASAAEVYITQEGKKYHQATCALIKNKSASAISEEEAQAKGYKPCKKCFKENKVTNSSTKKVEKKQK